MKLVSSTRALGLGTLLVLGFTAACSGDSPTAPSAPPPAANVPFSITTLQAGTGNPATVGEILRVAFTGWLYDINAVENKGTMFDESPGFGFVLGESRLIAGFNQGADGIRLGEKRRVVIPPDLGFGSGGSSTIPPNSTLIFELELLTLTPVVPFEITEIVVGTGDLVDTGQTVTVALSGWLYDENAVDNKGENFEAFPSFSLFLGSSFDGLDMGIAGMRVGGDRRIVIPPLLGFGSAGSDLIPPFATLLYEVTLLSTP